MKKYLILLLLVLVVILPLSVWFLIQKYNDYQNPACKNCNLIIISVDTLRADHMSLYGYDKNTTPNIDKWAKDAFVFTNARTMVPTTYPSFAMLLTAKDAFESGIYSNSVGYSNDETAEGFIPLGKNTTTLAQILKKNNYITAAFINTESLNGELTSLNKGFDVYKQTEQLPLNGPTQKDKEYKSFTNIEEAFRWIEKNKDKKFFVWIHLMEPHAPYYPSKEFYCKFDTKYCDQIKSFDDLQKLEKLREENKECKPEGISDDTVGIVKTVFDGAIGTSDKLIGDIFKKIDDEKLTQNSIVMLMGDHGESFEHNYYFFHNHMLYDSFIKIPLVIKVPGFTNNGRKNNNIQITQIMPTLLELLNLKPQETIKTSPFTPLLTGKGTYTPDTYMFSVNNNLTKFSIQDEKYKYIYSSKTRNCQYNGYKDEVYDLSKDKEEMHNLYSENDEVSQKLKYELFNYLNLRGISTTGEKGGTTKIDKDMIEKLKALGY